METEAKYYIPEIEEFRVGFECEYFNRHCEKYIPITIDRSNYNIDDTGDYENDYLFSYRGENKFRVKYLDSEDIESLGGVKISDYEYNINGAILQINCSDNTHITILEIRQEWEMTAVPSKTAEYYFPLFMGKIKNKSELKQVLKMIGVQ